MIFNKPIEQIELVDLQRLVDDGVPEGRQLDYKQEFPQRNGDDNKELLYDLTSFTNASGGYLIYGIAETDGIPSGICGVDTSLIDAEKLRIENLLRDGVEPRIPIIQMHQVKMENGISVLVIHIGRSWTAPHMVKYRGTSKFYSRNSAGKYPLDVGDQDSVSLSETISDKSRTSGWSASPKL